MHFWSAVKVSIRKLCVGHGHAFTPSSDPQQPFEDIYRKCAVNFIATDLREHYVLVESKMPVDESSLVTSHLFDSIGDELASDNFAISAEDNTYSAGNSKSSPCDPRHARVLCFRTLRGNPAQMNMVPDAPRIRDYKACVAVLEHVIADKSDATFNSCRILQVSDGDLDARTIVVGPSTFEYDEYRSMRRAKLGSTPVYDFVDNASLSAKCTSAAFTDVMQGLLHTMMLDGHTDFCYTVTSSSARTEEQLAVLASLEKLSLVSLVRTSTDGETNWRISSLGRSRIRLTFGFDEVEQMTAPLLGRVLMLRMEASR